MPPIRNKRRQLPNEIVSNIFEYVRERDLQNAMSVCRVWYLEGVRHRHRGGLPHNRISIIQDAVVSKEYLEWAMQNGLYPHDEPNLLKMIINNGNVEMFKIAMNFYIEQKKSSLFCFSYRREFYNILKEVISNYQFHIMKWLLEEFYDIIVHIELFNIIYVKYAEIKYSNNSCNCVILLKMFKYAAEEYKNKLYTENITHIERVVSFGLYELLPILHKDELVKCQGIIGNLIDSRYQKLRQYDVDLCLKWLLENNYSIPSNVSEDYLYALEHPKGYNKITFTIPKYKTYIMRKLLGLDDE